MPNPITSQEIAQLKSTLDGATATDPNLNSMLSAVYSSLNDQGYAYANWAKGVVNGDTISGIAAIDYVKGTALMGLGGPACQNLSPEAIQKIKLEMAKAYLEILATNAETSGGKVTRDIRAGEVLGFHQTVLENNGLSIDNWMLTAPFAVLKQLGGDQLVEQYWTRMRETGGEGPMATFYNMATLGIMKASAQSSDLSIQQMANNWLQFVPGVFDQQFWNVVDQWLRIHQSDMTWGPGLLDLELGIDFSIATTFNNFSLYPQRTEDRRRRRQWHRRLDGFQPQHGGDADG